MQIVKITGSANSGKSTALQTLAESHEAIVIPCATLMAAYPLLMKKVSALDKNVFVDDVTEADLVKITKLAKLYPATYHIYVAGSF